MDTTISLAVLAAFISAVVEFVKNLIPPQWKDDKGILFKRKGKLVYRLPDLVAWPLLSFVVGMVVFSVLNYNLLGLGDQLGSVISGGAVGTSGGAAWYHSAKVAKTAVTKLATKPPETTESPTETPSEEPPAV